jgi:hypothetical protein
MKPRSSPIPKARQSRGTKVPPSSQPPESRSTRPSPAETETIEEKPSLLLLERCPSPEKLAVPISIFEPNAQTVLLAGSFNDWQPEAMPLNREGEGHWSIELMLKPGRYEYRFVVDGEWRDDPLARRYAANPFGGVNSVVEVF